MSLVRTFIAIEVSQQIRSEGANLIRELSDVAGNARWVQTENIHLTLKFLGEVEDRELHTVCKAAGAVARTNAQFSIECRSVGAFPSLANPGTIWMGVDDAHQQLGKLHSELEDAMADLGFPAEHRPYQGHLTLGRMRSKRVRNAELSSMIENLADREFGTIAVRELTVFSSELERRGPTYTVLARCPLA